MHVSPGDLETRIASALRQRGIGGAEGIAWAGTWLESCGYPGVKLLTEALADAVRSVDLKRDALGIDLQNVSCVFLAPAIMADVAANGRAFLRNVRHGLYLLPFTVRDNIGVGCPVDPAFAVGGPRVKNPYTEKLEFAATNGLEVDEQLLLSIYPST